MTMKIAVVAACPFPAPQGSQVLLQETALALQRRGHEVHLVVYGYGLGEAPEGLILHPAPNVLAADRIQAGPHWRKPFLDVALARTLRRVIHRYAVDAVIAHNYEGLLVALAAGKRPLLYYAHNAMSDELPYYFAGAAWARRLGQWLDKTFPKRADRIVVPHKKLAGHLIVRGCDHRRITVIAPPIDALQFTPSVVGKPVPPVLYAGNLDAYQNLELLRRTMLILQKRLPQVRLIVATGQPSEIPFAEVRLTPDFDSLRKLLAEDSVFVVPRVSWSGYPIKLLNAMAAGKPIVACQSAAFPIVNGINGLTVPDNDPHAFAEALYRLLVDPRLRAELGRHARETALHEFNPESVGRQLEAVLNALVSVTRSQLGSGRGAVNVHEAVMEERQDSSVVPHTNT
jgi:glycosyltransferase involved in cell wall biosynthesis